MRMAAHIVRLGNVEVRSKSSENLKGKRPLERFRHSGKIILKRILKNWFREFDLDSSGC
jgi:hypothetical protein